jgi:hypothetical protein
MVPVLLILLSNAGPVPNETTDENPLRVVAPAIEKLPESPLFRRNEGRNLVPPSTGKAPKEEAAPKASPSSYEGVQEGLSLFAASPSMRVSSNSVAIEFVDHLHQIITARKKNTVRRQVPHCSKIRLQ